MFTDPTRAEFLEALELDLRLRGVAFEQWDLIEFLEACWVRIAEEPDVLAWADRFKERLAEVEEKCNAR